MPPKESRPPKVLRSFPFQNYIYKASTIKSRRSKIHLNTKKNHVNDFFIHDLSPHDSKNIPAENIVECISTLKSSEGSITFLKFSPCGQYLLVTSTDGVADIYDVNGQPLYRLFGLHHMGLNTAAWSPCSNYIALGCDDGFVSIWNLHEQLPLLNLKRHVHHVLALGWSNDGTKIVSGSVDGSLCLFQANSGSLLRQWESHGDIVRSACFSKDDTMIISSSNDGTLRYWDVGTGFCAKTLQQGNEVSHGAHTMPLHTDLLAAVGCCDGCVRVYDVVQNTTVMLLAGHINTQYALPLKFIQQPDPIDHSHFFYYLSHLDEYQPGDFHKHSTLTSSETSSMMVVSMNGSTINHHQRAQLDEMNALNVLVASELSTTFSSHNTQPFSSFSPTHSLNFLPNWSSLTTSLPSGDSVEIKCINPLLLDSLKVPLPSSPSSPPFPSDYQQTLFNSPLGQSTLPIATQSPPPIHPLPTHPTAHTVSPSSPLSPIDHFPTSSLLITLPLNSFDSLIHPSMNTPHSLQVVNNTICPQKFTNITVNNITHGDVNNQNDDITQGAFYSKIPIYRQLNLHLDPKSLQNFSTTSIYKPPRVAQENIVAFQKRWLDKVRVNGYQFIKTLASYRKGDSYPPRFQSFFSRRVSALISRGGGDSNSITESSSSPHPFGNVTNNKKISNPKPVKGGNGKFKKKSTPSSTPISTALLTPQLDTMTPMLSPTGSMIGIDCDEGLSPLLPTSSSPIDHSLITPSTPQVLTPSTTIASRSSSLLSTGLQKGIKLPPTRSVKITESFFAGKLFDLLVKPSLYDWGGDPKRKKQLANLKRFSDKCHHWKRFQVNNDNNNNNHNEPPYFITNPLSLNSATISTQYHSTQAQELIPSATQPQSQLSKNNYLHLHPMSQLTIPYDHTKRQYNERLQSLIRKQRSTMVVSGSEDGGVCFWNILTLEEQVKINEQRKYLSLPSKPLVTPGELMFKLRAHHDVVGALDIHPYLPLLVTGGMDKDCCVKMWRVNGLQ